MDRRQFVKAAAAFLPALSVPNVNFGRHRLFPLTDQVYSTHAIDLVQQSIVIDMLHQVNAYPGVLTGWLARPETFTAADAQKLTESGTDVFALGQRLPDRAQTMAYLVAWNKFISSHSASFKRIDRPSDFAGVNSNGRSGILLTFQDSSHFESPGDVDLFYSLGQRLSQLTYNFSNRIGTGSFESNDSGLTPYGREIVGRMNSAGMMIDVSHCSDRTTLEAIDLSSGPVLITHANCRALNPGYPRAKSDEMIRNMAAKGGLMGITQIRFMVSGKEPVTIEHFLDHYDHVIKLVGPEFLGIGTDSDLDSEDGRLPLEERKKIIGDTTVQMKKYRLHSNEKYLIGIEGINHPKRVFDIVEGFIRRGYSDATIRLILGENFIRAAKQLWR